MRWRFYRRGGAWAGTRRDNVSFTNDLSATGGGPLHCLAVPRGLWYGKNVRLRVENGKTEGIVFRFAGLKILVILGLVVVWSSLGLGQGTPIVIHDAGLYFPDQPGNEWTYQGRITEGVVNQIEDKTFVNVSKVTGREKKDGVMVTVFHDTNPGDQGPTDSYYVRDVAGIRYYGSKPGTILEQQLIPYQIVRFPLEMPSSFQQLDRQSLNLGLDLDRDGQAETVDVRATVSVGGQETVTVPSGTYEQAIRMEAHMNLLVHLSGDGTRISGFDTMKLWLVKGVGLVKYIERQMVPMVGAGKDRLIEMTEELKEARLQGGTALLSRRNSATHGVLTRQPLNHEFFQIPFSSGLGAHP